MPRVGQFAPDYLGQFAQDYLGQFHRNLQFNRIKVRNGEITLDRLLKYKYWDENIEYKTFLYSFYSRMLREFYAKGFTKDSVINMDFINSLVESN